MTDLETPFSEFTPGCARPGDKIGFIGVPHDVTCRLIHEPGI